MKRKGNNANRQDFLHKRPALRRILHASGIHHGDFTALSNVKGSATDRYWEAFPITWSPWQASYGTSWFTESHGRCMFADSRESRGCKFRSNLLSPVTKGLLKTRTSWSPVWHLIVKPQQQHVPLVNHHPHLLRSCFLQMHFLWKAWTEIVWKNRAMHQVPSVQGQRRSSKGAYWETDWASSPRAWQ